MKAFRDRDGDLWVRTRAGSYRIAGSQRHAKRLTVSSEVGTSLATIERLYGPLRPWEGEGNE